MMRTRAYFLVFSIVTSLVLVEGCSDDDPVTPEPHVGTIVVNPTPDAITAPWTLVGPADYSHDGTGDQTLNDLNVGGYTLTWHEVSGYITPAEETKTLASDQTVTFSGVYVEETAATGTIEIDQTPDALAGAGWSLTGPHQETGSGDVTLMEMPVGEYTVAWDVVSGCTTPTSAPQTLAVDGTITFSGTYLEETMGTLVIPPEGGLFALNGERVELEVPADVFAEETTITFSMSDDGLGHSGYLAGTDVDFGTDLQGLAAPVTLRFRFSAEDLPEGASGASLDVCRVIDGAWTSQGAMISHEGELMVRTITRSSLSRHALVAQFQADEVCQGQNNLQVTTMGQLEAYRGCRVINGDLLISGPAITSLDALSSLESVKKLQLNMLGTNDLTGLVNLRHVSTVTLSNLSGELDLSVFDNLELCFNLEFRGCLGLTEIIWSPQVETMYSLTITNCPVLETVSFSNPQSIEVVSFGRNGLLREIDFVEPVLVNRSFSASSDSSLLAVRGLEMAEELIEGYSINDCKRMTTLPASGRLRSIGGELSITEAHALTDLSFLSGLEVVSGGIEISQCDNLELLAGLESLHSVPGGIYFGYNLALATLGNLHSLSSVRSLTIQACNALSDLAGLGGLTVEEDVTVINNESLVSLSGFGGTVGENLYVENNPNLASFNGLSLNHAEGAVFISNNGLTSLSGLSVLSGYTQLDITGNNGLTDLTGLHDLIGLTSITIALNGSLTDMRGLESLTEVPSLTIHNNSSITSLQGLDNLTNVSSRLSIHSNGSLRHLTGLESLFSVGGLHIQGNALQDLDGLSGLTRLGWTGYVSGRSIRLIDNTHLESLVPLYGLQPDPGTGDAIPDDCIITGNYGLGGDQEAWDFIDAIGGETMVGGDIIISN